VIKCRSGCDSQKVSCSKRHLMRIVASSLANITNSPARDGMTPLPAMSPPHPQRLTHQACSMPETAAKPGGLYLILRGAFQHAEFGLPQARLLS